MIGGWQRCRIRPKAFVAVGCFPMSSEALFAVSEGL